MTEHDPPATMRDVRALRNDLVELGEENARKLLAAHLRTLHVLAEHADAAEAREQEAQAFRVEIRAWMARAENRTLEILQGVPHPGRASAPSVPVGRLAALAYRARRRLDGPVTLRAVVYGFALAGLAASATSCALYFVR
jgi:hypothetical protein